MPANANRRYDMDLVVDDRSGGRWARRCTQCQIWLPETEQHFSWGANRRRYNSWCKPCVRVFRHSAGTRTVRTNTGARRFGVEIEFLGNSSAVARELNARGLECRVQSYNHRVSTTAWKIVPDGSVRNGAELVSPILQGDDGFEQLVKASAALVAAGAHVDRTTGLHVHHDVRSLRVGAFQQLVHNWFNSQDAIDQLVSSSRRQGANMFCQRLDASDVRRCETLTGMSRDVVRRTFSGTTRYRTLNVQSYPKYGTVEVRQHQGTIEAKKITAWVRFGQAMIDAAVAGTAVSERDAFSLVDALPLSADDKAYLHARATKLARQPEEAMA